MGTSVGLPTPSGGDWTKVKNDITDFLGGSANVTPDQIVGGTLVASGGLGSRPAASGTRGGGGGGGSGGGGRASVGRAASGLGGFGQAVRDRGLDAGLEYLGLGELRGRPAAEVVARISEHLCDGVDGLQGELMMKALQDTILEAAAVEGEAGYQNLGEALQSFLNREGIDGFVGAFLTNYVFDRVWAYIQSHVERRSDGADAATAMETAVERCCRGHVENLMDDLKAAGRFDSIDWFGRGAADFGQEIAADLESRISSLSPN